MDKCALWIAHSALHLIINNTFKLKSACWVIRRIELKTMALLPEIIIIKVREESHVCVD